MRGFGYADFASIELKRPTEGLDRLLPVKMKR